MAFNITSSLLSSVNFITTIVQLRAKGMGWMRMPFFVWTQFVTAFLLLLAFPPLEAAAFMQLMDRLAGSSLFSPAGLIVNGTPWHGNGGGTPLLWQHLFWFLGHPEVYVLILPGLGIIAEVIANNARKPLWGYNQMVYGLLVLGFLSMIVWAHHMYLTGMGTAVSAFFQLTTIIISVPTILILSSLIISLWGGSIRFTSPMLWATAFLPLFGIGGLTGIPLAFNAPDTFLHDSYYIIAHFHYVIAPGTIFAFFAGINYWYPKATGRMMSEFWNKVHFWPTMVLMNCIFFPMFLQGMAGMHRRMYDGGATYEMLNKNVLHWNVFISESAWLMGLAQIPFIINFCFSWKYGRKVADNPWEATTLEWSARRRRRTATSSSPSSLIAAPTSTACRATPTTSPRRTTAAEESGPEDSATTSNPRLPPSTNSSHGIPTPSPPGPIPASITASSASGSSSPRRSCSSARSSPPISSSASAPKTARGPATSRTSRSASPTPAPHLSSITMVWAWVALKERKFNKYRIFLGVTISAASSSSSQPGHRQREQPPGRRSHHRSALDDRSARPRIRPDHQRHGQHRRLRVHSRLRRRASPSPGGPRPPRSQTADDGLQALPSDRNTDVPWLGIKTLSLISRSTRRRPRSAPSNVTVSGVNVSNYGPVTISGSGTSYTITLAQPINAADRVTSRRRSRDPTYPRRLHVPPGAPTTIVGQQPGPGRIRNEWLRIGGAKPTIFGDINGDGASMPPTITTCALLIGTSLPSVSDTSIALSPASQAGPAPVGVATSSPSPRRQHPSPDQRPRSNCRSGGRSADAVHQR